MWNDGKGQFFALGARRAFFAGIATVIVLTGLLWIADVI
jgi:hypothetical protein